MTVTRTCLLIMAAVLLACVAAAFALWLAPPQSVAPHASRFGAQAEPEGAP